MPRHKKHDRPVALKIHIPTSTYTQVEASLQDPLYGKVKYGGWSDLITTLLNAWLDRKVAIHEQPIRVDLSQYKGDPDENHD